ncbi:HDIG domain-containing protein [Microgenomates group bacterium]|nr:HDIG domain-containing protein [Microgenomates group bacterium]
MLDYFAIINDFFAANPRAYKIYLVHAVLVTHKALAIARRLNLSAESRQFIEEAAMLHDIGVIKTHDPQMDCTGDLPYIAHGLAGGQILREKHLEKHALVAQRHIGVGLTKAEIISRNLPLPHEDFIPLSLEEKIITYADLFFSKREETLWQEDSIDRITQELAGFGQEQVATFLVWHQEFGP